MKNVFWLIPGKLAGRAGPDLVPWDVEHLKAGGIDAVLSVNDGCFVDPDDFEAHGIAYACIPFSANAPPMPGDLEICLAALPKAHAFVQGAVDSGKTVMIHCTSGKDRTGLVMSYFLMRTRGLTIDEAILEVRAVRPLARSAARLEAVGPEILRLLDPKSQ
jgi:protein-tyrosine phosphatase